VQAAAASHREELERYLQSRKDAEKLPAAPADYVSRFAVLTIELPTDIPYDINHLAESLDALLCRRFPGCLVKVEGSTIQIAWNVALGYAPEAVFNVV
jgi:hypothetical protein